MIYFIVENGEHFIVGEVIFKKKNDNEYCTNSYEIYSLAFFIGSHLTFYLFSALHYRKLFYANEIFQGILIHVKAMCEVYYFGQSNRIQPFCLLDRHAYQETLTLQEFSRRQLAQMNETVNKLTKFLDQVAVLAADACQVPNNSCFFFSVFFFLKNKHFFGYLFKKLRG